MRIRPLLQYQIKTAQFAIFIFFIACFFGNAIGAVGSAASMRNAAPGEVLVSNNLMLVSAAIFLMIFTGLAGHMNTRFFIARSVSRKESYVASLAFYVLLSAAVSVVNLLIIYGCGLVRMAFGEPFRGVQTDIMTLAAPDTGNTGLFLLFSMSILLMLCMASLLFSTLVARNRLATIGALLLVGIVYGSCLLVPSVLSTTVDVLKFMFTHETSIWHVILRQLGVAAVLAALVYPAMRKMPAARAK